MRCGCEAAAFRGLRGGGSPLGNPPLAQRKREARELPGLSNLPPLTADAVLLCADSAFGTDAALGTDTALGSKAAMSFDLVLLDRANFV